MKRITGILLVAAMLVTLLTISSVAITSSPDKTAADGFIAAEVISPSALNNNGNPIYTRVQDGYVYDPETDQDVPNYVYTQYTETQIPSSGLFDVLAKMTDVPKPIAGAQLFIYYNPDRVIPYMFPQMDKFYKNTKGAKVATFTDSELASNYFMAQGDPNVLNGFYKLGYVTVVNVKKDNYDPYALKKPWIRVPYTKTVASDNTWYRTKIYLDYQVGGIANEGGSNVNPEVGFAYYVNPDYVGPGFDILGAQVRADGTKGLRFGSVYFRDAKYDASDVTACGTVCYPTDLLKESELTLETVGALNIPATSYYSMDAKEITFTGVITGNIVNNPDMAITARTYITYKMADGSSATVYSDPISRSYNSVSSAVGLE